MTTVLLIDSSSVSQVSMSIVLSSKFKVARSNSLPQQWLKVSGLGRVEQRFYLQAATPVTSSSSTWLGAGKIHFHPHA